MKKILIALIISLLAIAMLVGCDDSNNNVVDITDNSIGYIKMSGTSITDLGGTGEKTFYFKDVVTDSNWYINLYADSSCETTGTNYKLRCRIDSNESDFHLNLNGTGESWSSDLYNTTSATSVGFSFTTNTCIATFPANSCEFETHDGTHYGTATISFKAPIAVSCEKKNK